MKFFKRSMSRADAIAKAIDSSEYGDSIMIHSVTCTDPNICTCHPIMIYIGSDEPKNPMGFRLHTEVKHED